MSNPDVPATPTSPMAAAVKRRRETESHGGDVTVQGTRRVPKPRASAGRGKRRKETAGSGSEDEVEDDANSSVDEEPVPPDVGRPEAIHGKEASLPPVASEATAALQAQANEAARNTAPLKLSADVKRARFAKRFDGKTPEETLAILSKTWRSVHYDHFHPPVIVPPALPGGRTMHKFVCKLHPSKSVLRGDYEDSTTNLKRHAETCEPQESPATELITSYSSGMTYSPARMRYLLAMWCARCHRNFSIVEDEEFREILRMLYPKVSLPSRWTVSRDVKMLAEDSRTRVQDKLKNLPNKLHLCIDGWTSPNVFSFLGITAHWFEDGEVKHIILDFIRLDKAHTGAYLAEKVADCLRANGLEKRILSITCDNAENNTTMMKELQKLVPEIRGVEVRIRCFAHVLNLVVKAVLSQFDRKCAHRRNVERDDEDDCLTSLDDPDDMDDTSHNDQGHDSDCEDDAREASDEAAIDSLEDNNPEIGQITREDATTGVVAVQKILKLSSKVWNSPHVRAELSHLASEAELNSEVLVRAVQTRWNTVTEVLDRAIEMREVLNGLCDMVGFNKRDGVRLRRYILTDAEWIVINELHQLLQPFLFATQKISASSLVLVHEVIPYFDVLTNHVDRFTRNTQLSPAVRAAAKRGRAMLDKYYSLTDDTKMFRIAMILHPRYKMTYFAQRDWEAEWIAEARDLIVTEWQTYYKPAAEPQPPSASTQSSAPRPKPVRRTFAAASVARAPPPIRRNPSEDMFASISGARQSSKDPLETYLEAPVLTTVEAPLAHWKMIYDASHNAPADRALATMALDYLSAQASSTDAERAFSRGRLTVPRLRHSLSDESVRQAMLLGSWARIPDLVPEKLAISLIKKHSRKVDNTVDAPGSATASGVQDFEVIIVE